MSEVVAPDALVATATGVRARRDLAALYADALRANLLETSEGALRRAYEIGRHGFARGLGILELVAMHHEALAGISTRGPGSAALTEQIVRAGEFLAESLSPYEMAHRGFREATSALRKLNETMEREIQRIAHSVHDEAGQLLDAARLAISVVGDDLPPMLRERLREVGCMLDRAETELRRLSHELRPTILDDLGLVPALQLLAEGISRRAGLGIRIENSLARRAAAKVETVLYRVVQEALTNVVRHARARNATIQIARRGKGNLRCSIRDDGSGFDLSTLAQGARGGLGLVGMRERLQAAGGKLQIRSQPGRGTELIADVPIED
jgi:two-component system, NarL family, sensor histidine kinase UhpB